MSEEDRKQLTELADTIKPSPAKDLLLMWLHLNLIGRAPQTKILSLAEKQCDSDKDLCCVYYIEAMICFYSDEISTAIDKATKCLHLSTRIGYKMLETQVLISLGRIYETLGYEDLGAEFANAASQTMSDQFRVRF
jgi:hypothetical protein